MKIEEMGREELVKELNSILDEMEAPLGKIRHLIMHYADSHDKIDLYGIDGGETERRLDGLGYINGWVIDRLMHRTYKDRGSVTHRIKKAQWVRSMNYRVNVFEKQKPYELVIILTEPNVRTRVMKGFERKIKSVVCPVSEKEIDDWKEQNVKVEVRK